MKYEANEETRTITFIAEQPKPLNNVSTVIRSLKNIQRPKVEGPVSFENERNQGYYVVFDFNSYHDFIGAEYVASCINVVAAMT